MSNYFNFFIPRHAEKADKQKATHYGIALIRNDEDISSHLKRMIIEIRDCNLEPAYDIAQLRASNNLKYLQDLDQNIVKEQKRLDTMVLKDSKDSKDSKDQKTKDLNVGTVIVGEVAAMHDIFEKLRRLKLLKLIVSTYQLFERACETDFHRRRANKFFFSELERISQAFKNGDMQYLRSFFVETLCSLKLLKKSAQDGLPNLRGYLRFIHALAEAITEHEHSKEKRELSFRRACKTMLKPIAFPDWVLKTPCDCLQGKEPLQGRLIENSLTEQLHAVQNYAQNMKEAREKCKNSKGDEQCACECNDCCVPQNPCCIELKSYVMDLMVVRETLENYEPGEIAHIQNVMAGETIKRTHKVVKETENYSENEATKSREEESEFANSERFEMQDAVQKTLAQDLSVDAGITASSTYGSAGSFTATANVAYARATTEAKQTARNYAKEITERSLMRIQEDTRKLTTKRVLQRVTEANVHKFEGGSEHVIGQYYWVNKRTVSQVMNWGKRMMYEFVIPEPAAQYSALLRQNSEQNTNEPVKPIKPSVKIDDITESNYKNYVDQYNLTDVSSINQSAETTVSAPIQMNPDPEKKDQVEMLSTANVSVPTGYTAVSFSISGGIDWGVSGAYCTIAVGASSSNQTYGNYSFPSGTLPNMEGNIPIAVVISNVDNLNVNVSIKCKRKPEIFDAWQMSIYEKIMAPYYREMEDYKLSSDETNQDDIFQIKGRNTFINREVERTELWKLVVSMLSCQHFDGFDAMKQKVQPCGYPQLDFQQAKDEGAFIQFFEQVYEVQQMMYLFYPYFWGKKCEWPEQFEQDSGDALFDKFLASGAARVTIPVRPGMEALALHYEQYGEIWMGEGEPDYDPESPHFLAMYEEIKSRSGNFQQDRSGLLDVDFDYNDQLGNQVQDILGGSDGHDKTKVAVHGTDFWWDWDDQTGNAGAVDDLKIEGDIDREIIIARKSYRIVDIQIDEGSYNGQVNIPTSTAQQNELEFIKSMRWIITLKREVEAPYCDNKPNPMTNIKYAVGAVYVGAEWDNVIPTSQVWLRPQGDDGYSKCLPCYPVRC